MNKAKGILSKIPNIEENQQALLCLFSDTLDVLEQSGDARYKEILYKLEKLAYEINDAEGKKIVSNMKPFGEKWDERAINNFINSKGIETETNEYYLVMNMMYNDYQKTASLVGMSEDVEFYFSLADEFITDIDGDPFKVQKYFKEDL